ncbi:MAG TPA: TIGR01459 family HAD-type hydrolase [Sphingomicrobium sp.]|nr:TIGR01459 family HAD-type hydrolase [Sphingomicrobium sp.]HXH52961.1 TIGR01459 family HAD-type hydrolase [Sphingomicrobium sp.]
MSFLDALSPRYRLILCDIWGCIHDGVSLYPGAAGRLRQWKQQGRTVVLITNAPRTTEAVEQQLMRLGLPRESWDFVATSGEAGIAALKDIGRPVGFIGTPADRAILESRNIEICSDKGFDHLACTGLDGHRRDPADYEPQLRTLAGRGVVVHCLNPDRVVIQGGVPLACAGALADIYESFGGDVRWYGKPHEAIYRHALRLGGDPSPDEVLAIGDGLQTDVLGAARMGFDCAFVTGGIHSGEPFPAEFGAENGLGEWHPVAVMDSLD